jgi:hypothetical protein
MHRHLEPPNDHQAEDAARWEDEGGSVALEKSSSDLQRAPASLAPSRARRFLRLARKGTVGGVAILATEFAWARNLLRWLRNLLRRVKARFHRSRVQRLGLAG